MLLSDWLLQILHKKTKIPWKNELFVKFWKSSDLWNLQNNLPKITRFPGFYKKFNFSGIFNFSAKNQNSQSENSIFVSLF
jgi:hypothetical protein